MAHLYISATRKSSGKTSVAIGLAAALSRRGLAVQTFKKGPDYIDPLWLARAAGRPCYNLDFFTQSAAEIRTTFCAGSSDADISLVEGNKGLFDGLDVAGTDSNAALATLLSAPVILVIDSTGITRGIAPLVRGYLDFDDSVQIHGLVLNKVAGARHESKLRAALERYTDAEVLGVLGRDGQLEIPERHLGLVPANEVQADSQAQRMITRLADAVAAGVDLDRMLAIGSAAPCPAVIATPAAVPPTRPPDVRIAIARDAAFGFYYADDLEAFAQQGAELVPFDTLNDHRLPAADGLFIGGGFPECQLAALAANRQLLAGIRQALAAGLPADAECGGLMYLARSIRWQGNRHDLVGAVPADAVVEQRPQGRGYVKLQASGHGPWSPAAADSTILPAHEFHHARLENLPADADYAYRVLRGSGIDGRHDGIVIGNLVAGFAHHRHTAADPWVQQFVDFVRRNAAQSGR
jgi:cobyrinic acid a,c-diamide synthase